MQKLVVGEALMPRALLWPNETSTPSGRIHHSLIGLISPGPCSSTFNHARRPLPPHHHRSVSGAAAINHQAWDWSGGAGVGWTRRRVGGMVGGARWSAECISELWGRAPADGSVMPALTPPDLSTPPHSSPRARSVTLFMYGWCVEWTQPSVCRESLRLRVI